MPNKIYNKLNLVMKILSWNINNSQTDIYNRTFEIIDFINEAKADIIGLQEVIKEMYIYIYSSLSDKYNISEMQDRNYFTILLVKKNLDKNNDIKTIDFSCTGMGRQFTYKTLDDITYITTHLESLPQNKRKRQYQVEDITDFVEEKKLDKVVIFGDLNYIFDDETINGFNYITHDIENINDYVYTYDSTYNYNATPPYRSNLDRFYVKNIDNCKVNLKTNHTSDHFPIILEF